MSVKDHTKLVDAIDRAEAALRDARDDLERIETDEITVSELAARFHVPEDAVLAFVQTVGEVLGERPLSVGSARRAALLAAAEEVWEDELGPLLSSAQVRELLGGVSRQRVDELLRARRLIGLRDNAGRRRFPAFQFQDGRPLERVVAAFWTVADAAVSEWTAASWCVSPDQALEARSPAQWAREGRDGDLLARAARQDAARLAR